MMDFDKLYADVKKCPFCGGEAGLIVKHVVSNLMNAQYCCKKCKATARPSKLYDKYDAVVIEAKELWNRRVGEDG